MTVPHWYYYRPTLVLLPLHFQGDKTASNKITTQLLDITLSEIEPVFERNRKIEKLSQQAI